MITTSQELIDYLIENSEPETPVFLAKVEVSGGKKTFKLEPDHSLRFIRPYRHLSNQRMSIYLVPT